MFEASFISLLTSDTDLTDRLATYGGSPAIFSDFAPEEADAQGSYPYLVFDISQDDDENLIITDFTIDIDIFGLRTKSKIIREIVERLLFTCDRHIITTDSRFTTIRLFRNSSEFDYEKNSKVTHYNVVLDARGTRKKWADQI